MKIFDCFLYNDEDLILDIRFNTLSKFVYKFVIVESKFDHQGNEKKLNFKIENFKKFKDKIIYLIIEKFPEKLSNWERENFQRNYIVRGLTSANENDYVLVSDVDEIPNLSKITDLNNFKYTAFEQKIFYYKINLENKTNPFWYGSKICKKKYLKSPQWMRKQKVKTYPFWFIHKTKWNIVKEGGWHFSYLMSPEKIKQKLSSFAHSEFNNRNYNNIHKIKESIEGKKDLFDRPILYKKVKINHKFPNYILENLSKFKNFIIE